MCVYIQCWRKINDYNSLLLLFADSYGLYILTIPVRTSLKMTFRKPYSWKVRYQTNRVNLVKFGIGVSGRYLAKARIKSVSKNSGL